MLSALGHVCACALLLAACFRSSLGAGTPFYVAATLVHTVLPTKLHPFFVPALQALMIWQRQQEQDRELAHADWQVGLPALLGF